MAETVVAFVLNEVYQLLKEEVILQKRIHQQFSEIKDELESIQAFIKDADRWIENIENTYKGIITWIKQISKISNQFK